MAYQDVDGNDVDGNGRPIEEPCDMPEQGKPLSAAQVTGCRMLLEGLVQEIPEDMPWDEPSRSAWKACAISVVELIVSQEPPCPNK